MVPTSQEWKTSDAQRLAEIESDVTVPAISWDLEHQDLLHIAYSGSVDRFRSACYWRPASKTCRRVSCAQKRGEMAAHPHSFREAGPEGAWQFRRACCASIDRERVLHTASTRMFSKDNSFQVTLRNAIRERSPDQPGPCRSH